MTELEILMPVAWNTTVLHIFAFHTVDIMESAGPYCECNMLDIERFHTAFKKLARGKGDVMASIRENWYLLESVNQNRLVEDHDWTRAAPRSTAAGVAAQARNQALSSNTACV